MNAENRAGISITSPENQHKSTTLMILGTTSNAGKTTIAIGLCRIFSQGRFRTAPFKGWNMSLNSRITSDGGEIGAGQYLQAEAAGTLATVDMNPILLKPEPNGRSQIIVRGKVATPEEAQRVFPVYERRRIIRESLDRIRNIYDVIVIEGAGGCAEPNRFGTDVANMDIAKYAKAPVLIVGNIDPGGVFASLLGAAEIIKDKDPEAFGLI